MVKKLDNNKFFFNIICFYLHESRSHAYGYVDQMIVVMFIR